MQEQIPRILISGVSSGSGKTTMTCAILQALCNRGLDVMSFKCGPDYIDPMFHSRVMKIPSRNLDCFFTDENTTKALFINHAKQKDIAVLEGVMGHYDGLGGVTSTASAHHLATITNTPTLLVVDAKGMSLSIVALIQGFLQYEASSPICGILLNRVSPMLYPRLKELIETKLSVSVIGYLPERADCVFGSRHLGLITADEIENLQDVLVRLGEQAEKTIDLDKLLCFAQKADVIEAPPLFMVKQQKPVRIAVAKDSAFCFYYEDNLDLLRRLGAELISFRPLYDKSLPSEIDGILLGGGYPELYAKELSENKEMKQEIHTAVTQGVPCIAECGGFLYLHDTLKVSDVNYPMVGVIKSTAYQTPSLSRFGYITLTSKTNNLLCKSGEQIKAHEFHYFDSHANGESFLAQKPIGNRAWDCAHTSKTFYAGFPHLYFYANPEIAERFVDACFEYKQKQE